MDFLVRFPPNLVQRLNEFTVKGNNEQVLDMIYQDLTRVFEFEEKPPQLPINAETTLRVLDKLVKNIGLSRSCKCLTQSYYVLTVLIDEDLNNNRAALAAMNWLENPNHMLWSRLKDHILYFIDNPDEFWPSEYCLRYLAVFLAGSSERQILVGTTPGVVSAIVTALQDPQVLLLSSLLEHSLSCVSSLLGRNMLFSTRIGTQFIELKGQYILYEAVADVISRFRIICEDDSKAVTQKDMSLLVSAVDALRSYFAWITQHYEYAAETFDRAEYCGDTHHLQRIATLLYSMFDLQAKETFRPFITDVLLTTCVCYGDMIRNNFEPEGPMLELGLLWSPPASDSEQSDGNDGDRGHVETKMASATLLDRILGAANMKQGGKQIIDRNSVEEAPLLAPSNNFLMDSMMEWGEESAMIASALSMAYFRFQHQDVNDAEKEFHGVVHLLYHV